MPRSQPLITTGVAAVLLFLIAACDKDASGTALPESTSSAAPSSVPQSRPQIPTDQHEPGTVTSAPSAAPSPLEGVSPCSVVPPETVAQFGGTGIGEEKKLGIGRHCGWYPSGKDAFSVAFFDTAGVNDARGEGLKTPIRVGVGLHDAFQQRFIGGCAVYLAMGATSRVDVAITGTDSVCEKAKSLADAVEPLLPPQVK